MTTLIMSGERPQQIADGDNTLTCRPVVAGDTLREGNPVQRLATAVISAKGIAKWKVGSVYGIKPARTAPVCLVDLDFNEHALGLDRLGNVIVLAPGKVVTDLRACWTEVYRNVIPDGSWSLRVLRDDILFAESRRYHLLQVRILALARVDVRVISHEDAKAAGFNGAWAYVQWWAKQYDKCATERDEERGYLTRPLAFCDAWQIRFERVLA